MITNKKLVSSLISVIILLISVIGFTQDKALTQKDIDMFIAIQPAMARAVKRALKDYKNMTPDQKECSSCKAGTPSPYRKELDQLFKKYRISSEDFAFINARVISLYSLVSAEGALQETQKKIDTEKKGFWGGLKKSTRGLVENMSKKQKDSLGQYTQDEIDLITKNRPALDKIYSSIEEAMQP